MAYDDSHDLDNFKINFKFYIGYLVLLCLFETNTFIKDYRTIKLYLQVLRKLISKHLCYLEIRTVKGCNTINVSFIHKTYNNIKYNFN